MKKIAKFEKVSFAQFIKDWQQEFPKTTQKECEQIYQNLQGILYLFGYTLSDYFLLVCEYEIH